MGIGFDPRRPVSVLLGAMLLGIVAGLVTAAYLSVTGEPAIEEANAAAAAGQGGAPGHQGEEEPEVSREVQRGAGLFGGYALSGAAFGGIFGVTFLALRKRVPRVASRAVVTGAVLAGAITISPWLKYPPNPPAVGDPATLAERQTLYVAVIVLTLVVLVAAAQLASRLRAAGWVDDQRLALVVAAVVIPMGVIYALMPPPSDEIAVPATLLWRFRIASLAGNLLLWAVLALGFALLAAAAERRSRAGVLADL